MYLILCSGLVYNVTFSIILGTWVFVDSYVNLAAILTLPWMQWPFELIDSYIIFFLNDITYGNLYCFRYTSFVSSLLVGTIASFGPSKKMLFASIAFITLINLITAFSIIEEPSNFFLNRKIAVYSVFWGVPMSFHLACRTAVKFSAKKLKTPEEKVLK